MIWKIYFVLMALFAAVSLVDIFQPPQTQLVAAGINLVFFIVEIAGLYAYAFQKHFLTPKFWFGYFWFNVALDVLFLMYTLFPHVPILEYYSFLVVGNPGGMINVLVGIAFDLPLLYILYQLSKGNVVTQKKKVVRMMAPGIPQWGLIQTALWGYSLIINIVFVLSSLLPDDRKISAPPTYTDTLYAVMIVLPILLFWLLLLKQYKAYTWNWWKVTLVANGILYSGMMVFGSLSARVSEGSGGLDYIAMLQFLIIFAGLIVFGREQFKKSLKKVKEVTIESID